MKISIVIPLYNEEESVRPLVEEILAVDLSAHEPEILLVDDGSSDATWAHILECAAESEVVKGLRCLENQGQTSAMLHGMYHASGEVIVTLDGDLQNDPADIPALLQALDGVDVACGYRANRRDTWSRRVGSRLANRVRNWVTHDGMIDTGCSLKAFRAACVHDLPFLEGVHRFMPAYFQLHGRTVKQIPVNHRFRQYGTSKYTNLKRLPRTIYDLFGFNWYRKRILRKLDVQESDKGKPSLPM